MTHERRIWGAARWVWAIAILLGAQANVACTSGNDERDKGGSEDVAGTVHLALTTGSTHRFRLSGAEFAIRDALGTLVLELDSGADPEGEALQGELPQGSYTISLAPGWTLAREDENGEFVEVQAALLSLNPREFRVAHGQTTELVYAFTTDAGTVELGRGALSVGVDVVDTGTELSCRVLEPSACPEGLTCLLAGETGAFCAQPGSLPVGSECSNEQCVAGAQCLRLEGETTGVCRRYCDPNASSQICSCRSLSFDDTIGICESPPECEPNCTAGASFTYAETPQDDVDPRALFEFFAGLPSVSENDYLFFEVAGGTAGGAWCSANAAFYVNSYLALAPGAGVVNSGAWEKYTRSVGGSWSGPDTSSYTNYFGGNCSNPYDWCSEWGLGGRFLGIVPWSTGWESRTNSTVPSGSVITVTVGPSRAAACGF